MNVPTTYLLGLNFWFYSDQYNNWVTKTRYTGNYTHNIVILSFVNVFVLLICMPFI